MEAPVVAFRQVDRLVDFRHASKVDQIEQALEALGRRLVVTSAA